MIQLTTPSAGYGNVTDLKSLRKQRDIKAVEQEKYDGARSIVDRVEARIEDVAKLGKTKHNQSLNTEQVVLDQYRSGVKFAASMAGHIAVYAFSFSLAGMERPMGTEAVLNRNEQGQVTSFEAVDQTRGRGYDSTTSYAKSTADDGSTTYYISERQQKDKMPGKPLLKATTVKMDANGTLFIDESTRGLK